MPNWVAYASKSLNKKLFILEKKAKAKIKNKKIFVRNIESYNAFYYLNNMQQLIFLSTGHLCTGVKTYIPIRLIQHNFCVLLRQKKFILVGKKP